MTRPAINDVADARQMTSLAIVEMMVRSKLKESLEPLNNHRELLN